MARVTDRERNCRNCVYYRGQFDENLCCNYIFDEDRRRPCPPGDDCTVKKKRPRKRRTWEDRHNKVTRKADKMLEDLKQEKVQL